MKSWWTRAQERLQEFSNNHYREWLQTKEGKKYSLSIKQGKSPYYFGFTLPDWFHEIIDALGKNDEVAVKYLIHLYLIK